MIMKQTCENCMFSAKLDDTQDINRWCMRFNKTVKKNAKFDCYCLFELEEYDGMPN